MSINYQNSRDVPLSVIISRLEELSDAVIGGRESQEREFTMRIPAECDRDADLVIGEAARRIVDLRERVEKISSAAWAYINAAQDPASRVFYRMALEDAIAEAGGGND